MLLPPRWQTALRKVGFVIFMTLALSFVLGGIHFFLTKKLVSDEYVLSLYSSHKAEIERLRDMCLEDRKKSPLRYFGVSARGSGTDCVRRVGSVERCQEYARLFASSHVTRVHWEEDNIWILVDGWGWAGKGVRKGLMWRATPIPPQDPRCGQHYAPIEDGWYIYQIDPNEPLFVARPSVSGHEAQMKCVAIVGATDQEAQIAVRSLLTDNRIDCFMEGSVVYGVYVSPKDATRARGILVGSEKLKRFFIQFPNQ
jgi:hypothetical protein